MGVVRMAPRRIADANGEESAAPVVAAIYTGRGLDDQVTAVAAQILGPVRLTSIIDDAIIFDINRHGGLSAAVTRRLIRYYRNAEDAGADVIFNTCSSVGEIVALGRQVVDVPIVRIDEPMAELAAKQYRRIGVLATLESTLGPTRRLIAEKAEGEGRTVEIVAEVAKGAFEALAHKDPATHDELVGEAVGRLSDDVEAVVLAQASMARMQERLQQRSAVPVLTSLSSGLEAVRAALEGCPRRSA